MFLLNKQTLHIQAFAASVVSGNGLRLNKRPAACAARVGKAASAPLRFLQLPPIQHEKAREL
jgi:hypothetical protein